MNKRRVLVSVHKAFYFDYFNLSEDEQIEIINRIPYNRSLYAIYEPSASVDEIMLSPDGPLYREKLSYFCGSI